jgi:ferrochelatase
MSKVKTGIVMMNLGGPATLDEVEPFLLELFADREIIQRPVQKWLGPFIARRRTPRVRGLYASIGGGSPSLRHTHAQGRGMVERLDRLSPETAPHQFYVAFRYAKPKSEDALRAMHADGVERAVAFTQYPQDICAAAVAANVSRNPVRLAMRAPRTWKRERDWRRRSPFMPPRIESKAWRLPKKFGKRSR